MRRALAGLIVLGSLACTPKPAPPLGVREQEEALLAWARAFEGAVSRIAGCGTGAEARALFAPDGYQYTTDSATHSLSGETATGLFDAAACARRSTSFKFDSLLVRALSPGVGAVIGTYVELVTDTAEANVRLRGSAQWTLEQRDSRWIALMVAGTERSEVVK